MKNNCVIRQAPPIEAKKICATIISDLPEWFGIPEANERYINGCLERTSFVAKIENENVGLIVLEFPFPNNANIYWMAISKKYHGQGIGAALLKEAENYSFKSGIQTVTVETLSLEHQDPYYLKTYHFYEKVGFKPLFELQPYGPELTMCYLIKKIKSFHTKHDIRLLAKSNIPFMVSAFSNIGWNKPTALFEKYLEEQIAETKWVWVAFHNEEFAGYVTLELRSEYGSFSKKNIPEIKDLNVLPQFRNQGIASALLDYAEEKAKLYSDVIGIGVGLYADYGNAQKLYIKRGYVPDGNGVTYHYQRVEPGKQVVLDDDLVLWFTKSVNI